MFKKKCKVCNNTLDESDTLPDGSCAYCYNRAKRIECDNHEFEAVHTIREGKVILREWIKYFWNDYEGYPNEGFLEKEIVATQNEHEIENEYISFPIQYNNCSLPISTLQKLAKAVEEKSNE